MKMLNQQPYKWENDKTYKLGYIKDIKLCVIKIRGYKFVKIREEQRFRFYCFVTLSRKSENFMHIFEYICEIYYNGFYKMKIKTELKSRLRTSQNRS